MSVRSKWYHFLECISIYCIEVYLFCECWADDSLKPMLFESIPFHETIPCILSRSIERLEAKENQLIVKFQLFA